MAATAIGIDVVQGAKVNQRSLSLIMLSFGTDELDRIEEWAGQNAIMSQRIVVPRRMPV
ncbi:hypothetical protein ABMB68_008581 [Bradyrhizobium sp. RT4a]